MNIQFAPTRSITAIAFAYGSANPHHTNNRKEPQMLKRFATLLTILLTAFTITIFSSCDGPESIVLDEILRENSTYNSPYTGGLIRIGTVKAFGNHIDRPVAIEWNGQTLYMLADHGKNERRAKYLFRLDKNTGIAEFVNRSAVNLGGSFTSSRGFTQVLYVSPRSLTWMPAPKNGIEGIDYPIGYTGEMLAVCPVLDSVVTINIETGLAGRITFKKDFCLKTPERLPNHRRLS